MCQQDLENMLSQGSEFYSRLVEHLTKLSENVSDFKNARTLQATDLCKQIGAPPPNSNPVPAFVPMGQQNYGQPQQQPGMQPGMQQPGMPMQGGMPPVMPPGQQYNYQFFQPGQGQ